MKHRKKTQFNGFTLIELIVVLAILGLILAIAVPNYMAVQTKAEETADQREAELLAEAMQRALADGTIWVETTDETTFIRAKHPKKDKSIVIGSKKKTKKKTNTNQSNFNKIFDPIYSNEPLEPNSSEAMTDDYYFLIDDAERVINITIKIHNPKKPTKPNAKIDKVLASFTY